MSYRIPAALAAFACFASTALCQESGPPKKATPRAEIGRKTADPLPKSAARFNGMLVGRLVKKDVERGTFIVNVDAVPRVWRNSKAPSPKSLIGKNVEVDGVFGKWLDVLLLVKVGETLECEARHDGGQRLTFPGELLRKVAPFKPGDYPVLPEDVRGFSGAVAGRVVTKNPDLLEIIVEVDRVLAISKNNSAKRPEGLVGQRVMLGGFWQRKDAYHGLKVNDRIEVGLQHIGRQSDHLSVREFVRKAKPADKAPEKRPADRPPSTSTSGFPPALQGFMGSLVGRLVEKDVERGTLALQVDAVPRVWKRNKARAPKTLVGRTVRIEGVSNRLLDVLLTTRIGETLEVAARHDGGDRLTFPGELFRKVAPYKPEDYPVLPDAFRGFQGVLRGDIVKKDPTMHGLIVKVSAVERSFDKSRAADPDSIVGHNVILGGFWRRKDSFAQLKPGDRIEFGARHEVTVTDVLSVFEDLRKVAAKPNQKPER